MKQFEELGRLLKERWKQHDYSEDAFTAVAMTVLGSHGGDLTVTLADVLRWAQAPAPAPVQVDAEFGRPLTVFHDPRFYIDILTWIDGTTDIHEHGFAGAFQVLSGSSIHARYRFHELHRYSEHLRLGDAELLGAELLQTGDVRPIHLGPRSAHALFHLDRPTLSLVVRTRGGVTHPLQLSYLRYGIAYNPFHKDQDSRRILSSLRTMSELAHPQLLERALAVSEDCDALTAFKIARLFAAFPDPALYPAFVAAPRSRHRRLFRALERGVVEERRTRAITARRALVHDDSHRFFLALLLNLRTPEDILGMVAQRVSDRPAVEVVLGWIRDLAAIAVGDSNALGADLDDTALEIIRLMLVHDSDDAVIRALADSYDEVDAARADVAELCGGLRDSLLLGPLFRAAG